MSLCSSWKPQGSQAARCRRGEAMGCPAQSLAVQHEGRADVKQGATTRVSVLTYCNAGAAILGSNSLPELAQGSNSAVVPSRCCAIMGASIAAQQAIPAVIQVSFSYAGGTLVNQLILLIQQHCVGKAQVVGADRGRALERVQTLWVLPSTQVGIAPAPVTAFPDANAAHFATLQVGTPTFADVTDEPPAVR